MIFQGGNFVRRWMAVAHIANMRGANLDNAQKLTCLEAGPILGVQVEGYLAHRAPIRYGQ